MTIWTFLYVFLSQGAAEAGVWLPWWRWQQLQRLFDLGPRCSSTGQTSKRVQKSWSSVGLQWKTSMDVGIWSSCHTIWTFWSVKTKLSASQEASPSLVWERRCLFHSDGNLPIYARHTSCISTWLQSDSPAGFQRLVLIHFHLRGHLVHLYQRCPAAEDELMDGGSAAITLALSW